MLLLTKAKQFSLIAAEAAVLSVLRAMTTDIEVIVAVRAVRASMNYRSHEYSVLSPLLVIHRAMEFKTRRHSN